MAVRPSQHLSAGAIGCPPGTQASRLHPGPHLHFNTMLFFHSTMYLGVRSVCGETPQCN